MNFAFAKTVGHSRRNGPDKLGEEHGLILRMMPSGSKQWIWRGTVHGHRRDLGLGAFPHVSLAEARAKALDYRRLARAGSDPATARPTPEPSTKHSKSRAPTFRKTASGPSTHWRQSRMPTSSDSRSSCARDRFICRHDRERELRDAATVRGREEINALLWAMARSIGPRPANPISRRRAETVRPPQSRDPSAAQGTRGYFRKSFPSGYIESNTNRVAGLPRWPPTRRCAACGVANGPTTLVSHVSFAGFPCGNAYCLEQALLGD